MRGKHRENQSVRNGDRETSMKPPLWRRAWERWKIIAHVIGNFQARLLLSLFYFLIVPPFALIVRLMKDPLSLRGVPGSSFWVDRDLPDMSSDAAKWQWYRRQY